MIEKFRKVEWSLLYKKCWLKAIDYKINILVTISVVKHY